VSEIGTLQYFDVGIGAYVLGVYYIILLNMVVTRDLLYEVFWESITTVISLIIIS